MIKWLVRGALFGFGATLGFYYCVAMLARFFL